MPGVSVACGHAHTVAIGAEEGDLWAWGAGDFAQLGLNSREHKALPARVGGREVFAGCRVAQVACGACHTAAVASDGALWMWGEGGGGRLGTGDTAVRLAPTRLGPESFGHAPVARVACGAWHTVAATTAGAVWGFGDNSEQQLGVCGGAGRRSCLWPTRVSEEQFGPGGTAIVELAAGMVHTVAVCAEGGVWSWGSGPALGHGDEHARPAPTPIGRNAFGGCSVLLVAAGNTHTVAVATDGGLWAFGDGAEGQLGLGDRRERLAPALVPSFGRVVSACCGAVHSLAVLEDGALWSWGQAQDGRYHARPRLAHACIQHDGSPLHVCIYAEDCMEPTQASSSVLARTQHTDEPYFAHTYKLARSARSARSARTGNTIAGPSERASEFICMVKVWFICMLRLGEDEARPDSEPKNTTGSATMTRLTGWCRHLLVLCARPMPA